MTSIVKAWNTPVHIQLFRWLDSESLNVLWGFNFYSLTVYRVMSMLIVFFITALLHFPSTFRVFKQQIITHFKSWLVFIYPH